MCGAPLLPRLMQEVHLEAGDAANQAQRLPQQQQHPEAKQQASHRPPAAALEALQERSRQALVVVKTSASWTSAHVAPDVAPGSTLCFAVCCMYVGSEDMAKPKEMPTQASVRVHQPGLQQPKVLVLLPSCC